MQTFTSPTQEDAKATEKMLLKKDDLLVEIQCPHMPVGLHESIAKQFASKLSFALKREHYLDGDKADLEYQYYSTVNRFAAIIPDVLERGRKYHPLATRLRKLIFKSLRAIDFDSHRAMYWSVDGGRYRFIRPITGCVLHWGDTQFRYSMFGFTAKGCPINTPSEYVKYMRDMEGILMDKRERVTRVCAEAQRAASSGSTFHQDGFHAVDAYENPLAYLATIHLDYMNLPDPILCQVIEDDLGGIMATDGPQFRTSTEIVFFYEEKLIHTMNKTDDNLIEFKSKRASDIDIRQHKQKMGERAKVVVENKLEEYSRALKYDAERWTGNSQHVRGQRLRTIYTGLGYSRKRADGREAYDDTTTMDYQIGCLYESAGGMLDRLAPGKPALWSAVVGHHRGVIGEKNLKNVWLATDPNVPTFEANKVRAALALDNLCETVLTDGFMQNTGNMGFPFKSRQWVSDLLYFVMHNTDFTDCNDIPHIVREALALSLMKGEVHLYAGPLCHYIWERIPQAVQRYRENAVGNYHDLTDIPARMGKIWRAIRGMTRTGMVTFGGAAEMLLTGTSQTSNRDVEQTIALVKRLHKSIKKAAPTVNWADRYANQDDFLAALDNLTGAAKEFHEANKWWDIYDRNAKLKPNPKTIWMVASKYIPIMDAFMSEWRLDARDADNDDEEHRILCLNMLHALLAYYGMHFNTQELWK